jgi:FKBP-type peptidyl-prolyl cis-trans isomerases 1
MLKHLLLLLLTVAFITCKKKENCDSPDTKAPQSEIDDVKKYITDNNIKATQHPTGLFYEIIKPGNEYKPNVCKTVEVNYKGMLTNSSVFDQNNNAKLPLSRVIVGWQQGLPLIGITGKIVLYIPPTLGYGSSAQPKIPANSILIFEIELLGF